MVKSLPDYVERRIVVEFGLQYAYLYITDGNGKLSDEESFKQPYRLERKECFSADTGMACHAMPHRASLCSDMPCHDIT